jgi:hypothetical protein
LVGAIVYTTLSLKIPAQNALFLFRPDSYDRGWTLANAAAIIIAHNHPSGHVEPSAEDHHLTEKIIQASTLIGITVHEHLIVSMTDDRYYSMADQGIIRGIYDTLRAR